MLNSRNICFFLLCLLVGLTILWEKFYDGDINNIIQGLKFIDIICCIIVAFQGTMDRLACSCLITTEENYLDLNRYSRFNLGNENAYKYEFYDEKNEKKENCYAYNVQLHSNELALGIVAIPLKIAIKSNVKIRQVELSDFRFNATNRGNLVCESEYKSKKPIISIVKAFQGEKTYITRLNLVCDYELEQILLNSMFYITMSVCLTTKYKFKIRKYFWFKISYNNINCSIVEDGIFLPMTSFVSVWRWWKKIRKK